MFFLKVPSEGLDWEVKSILFHDRVELEKKLFT